MLNQTTPVPNIVFDTLLPTLTESELKVLLVIIRQTYGWYDFKTKKRKQRDWISYSQFIKKTSLSRRIISEAIKKLTRKGIILVTDFSGTPLVNPKERKGQNRLYYSFQPIPFQKEISLTAKQFDIPF